jgi:16S rRNA G527 N7-methylase RsmG
MVMKKKDAKLFASIIMTDAIIYADTNVDEFTNYIALIKTENKNKNLRNIKTLRKQHPDDLMITQNFISSYQEE